jgi:hypothetical protein
VPKYQSYSVIFHAMIGYLHESLEQYDTALRHYAQGSLVSQMRIMNCMVQEYLSHTNRTHLIGNSRGSSSRNSTSPMRADSVKSISNLLSKAAGLGSPSSPASPASYSSSGDEVQDFLAYCRGISPLVGMQGYRLMLELVYRGLVAQLEIAMDRGAAASHLSKELELGSFRTFPGSHRNVGAGQQKAPG